MTFPVARLEWVVARRRRRLFLLNAGIPLLLVLPVALGGAPPHHAAAAYAILFVLFGTMGSAIPLLRDGEGGLLARMRRTGYPAWRFLLERVVAGTVVDLIQLTPSLGATLLLAGSSRFGGSAVTLAMALALALLAANVVGVWVAALARSLAEGALFGAVATLFLLHGSAVFRTPAPGGVGEAMARLLPFTPLHQGLLGRTGALPAEGPAGFAALRELLLPGGVTAAALLGTLAFAPLLLGALARGSEER